MLEEKKIKIPRSKPIEDTSTTSKQSIDSNQVMENIKISNCPDMETKYFFYKDPEGNGLVCGHCMKPLVNKKSLVRHITEVHIKKINFKCSTCNKGFFRKKNFEIHMNSHTKTNFKCNVCNVAEFSCVADLVEHKATHVPKEDEVKIDRNSETARTCVLCFKIFTRRDNLNRHIKKVHKLVPEDLPAIQKKIEEQERLETRLELTGNVDESDLEEPSDFLPEVQLEELDSDDQSFENLAKVFLEESEYDNEDFAGEEEKIDVILEPNEEITPENIEKYREGLRYLAEHTRPRNKEKIIIGTCHVCFQTFSRKDNYLRHLKTQHNLDVDPADPFKYNISRPPSPDLSLLALEPQTVLEEFGTEIPDLSRVKSEPDENICDMIDIKQEPYFDEGSQNGQTEMLFEPELKKIKLENETEDETIENQDIPTENMNGESNEKLKFQVNLKKVLVSGSLIKVVPLNLLKDPNLQEKPAIICLICNKTFQRQYNLDRHVKEVHLTA